MEWRRASFEGSEDGKRFRRSLKCHSAQRTWTGKSFARVVCRSGANWATCGDNEESDVPDHKEVGLADLWAAAGEGSRGCAGTVRPGEKHSNRLEPVEWSPTMSGAETYGWEPRKYAHC
ncbi:hypothetical protein Tco_0366385 [Tanacetum coccineum]